LNSSTDSIERRQVMPGEPSDPIAAATHSDPYPYYARLVAERPLYRDERLDLWVASSAAAVLDVLSSEICRVRPPAEPVPRSLVGSPAGEIFRQLVRMNDGDQHCPFKTAIVGTFDDLDTDTLLGVARERAAELSVELQPYRDRAGISRFMFALPVDTIATLLAVPPADVARTVDDVAAFVGGISPIASIADVELAKVAAARLMDLFRAMIGAQGLEGSASLLSVLATQARAVGKGAADLVIANGIGLMSQTYEATAGLIGNTLLALATHRNVLTAVRNAPATLGAVIQEVLLLDPPTQSTRRFVARSGTIAGQSMHAGDAILVMLAPAGRDPALNPNANGFDIARANRRVLNFGAGPHTCPAHRIAALIAEVAVGHLLANGIELDGLVEGTLYRRSNHLRIPIFTD